MAIMHTRLLGIVNSDLEIVRDTYGTNLSCDFTMLVKEGTQRIPFIVHVTDRRLIQDCVNEIIRGSVVLVEGIIEIKFRDPDENECRPHGMQLHSNMALACKKIDIISVNDITQVADGKKIRIVVPEANEKENTPIETVELPF